MAMNEKDNGQLLKEMLKIIENNPGIRPSELNRRLNREHTAYYRSVLIKRGLVRKRQEGPAVYYYPVK